MDYELIILDRDGWRRWTLPLAGHNSERLLFASVMSVNTIADGERRTASKSKREAKRVANRARWAAAARRMSE